MRQRASERWAGVFYIMATVAPIASVPFVGFLGGHVSGERIPDYFVAAAAQSAQVAGGTFIELLWALSVVGLTVTLVPILWRHNAPMAVGFFSLRTIEAVCTIVGSMCLMTVLTLSQEYVMAGAPPDSSSPVIGTAILALRDWSFPIGSGLIWSLSAMIVNLLLIKHRLIPRWLSIWGLVGGTISFANYVPVFFGISMISILFLPIAVQEMVFAVWLIAKGMRPIDDTTETIDVQ